MNKKDRMKEITQSLKANLLVLPKDVTIHSAITPEGHVAYVFRHQHLGELGKMVIIPHSLEKTQWDSHIAGDPDDPMTQKRREIIEPFFKNFINEPMYYLEHHPRNLLLTKYSKKTI